MDGLIQAKEEILEHGSIITGQSRQLIDLVRQILLFAATDNGSTHYVLRPLSVSEIMECVKKDVAVLVSSEGFTLQESIEQGLPSVMGDLRALSHCLQNLIANSVKYSGKSRWIGISASYHDPGHHEEVCITVSDRGLGISESELPHIFEPFYRSAKSVDAQIHGTGLGLAVANRIAEAMGGRLSVKSKVNVGSSFTLHLNVVKQEVSTAEEQQPVLTESR
jgi:signal transduction histidine kinase